MRYCECSPNLGFKPCRGFLFAKSKCLRLVTVFVCPSCGAETPATDHDLNLLDHWDIPCTKRLCRRCGRVRPYLHGSPPTRTLYSVCKKHEVEHAWKELLRRLAPEPLRETVLLPTLRWRERYEPKNLSPLSRAEVMEESFRFVIHMFHHWFGARVAQMHAETPAGREFAKKFTDESLTRILGNEGGVERLTHQFVQRHGMRALLERLTEQAVDRALVNYASRVHTELIAPLRQRALEMRYIHDYTPDLIAERYVELLCDLPISGVEFPPWPYCFDQERWLNALTAHARLILRTA